jgi:4-carboxymuconolactone decarboxylase
MTMSDLNPRERELVALGAAMGSNCVPCVEYHIPEARKAGLTDSEIHEAIRLADKVRQVPARKVLHASLKLLPTAENGREASTDDGCGCDTVTESAGSDGGKTPQPMDRMVEMVSRMMNACGCCQGLPTSQSSSGGKLPIVGTAKSEGCGCK